MVKEMIMMRKNHMLDLCQIPRDVLVLAMFGSFESYMIYNIAFESYQFPSQLS